MTEVITHIDYKDTETLKRFLNPHGKIMPRRRTGLSAGSQRALAEAVKRARFMALLPYIVR
jgi:small subunit ribosomal protein S18